MKRFLAYLICTIFIFASCTKHDFDIKTPSDYQDKQQIENNVQKIFGETFPKTQDWINTINGNVQVYINTSDDIVKIQVLSASINKDQSIDMVILNEKDIKDEKSFNITYDVPNNYECLFINFINDKGQYFYKPFNINTNEVYLKNISNRSIRKAESIILPETTFEINNTVESYASTRNWLPNEVLYNFNNIKYNATEYSNEFISIFKNVIFSYFKNGRKYNNLPILKKSGYYNESFYIITTGGAPIVVSPAYKNDGGYSEICNGDLYYYYFKGNPTVEELEALPKYKAINLSDVFSNEDNDRTSKRASYGLVYFGDGKPEIGTQGTYNFPVGYKIGFMYRSNKEKLLQGELYGDGRLNYNINNYGNFKTSKLESTAPRMGWTNVNDKIFLCIESGTDADFNDLIIEVEGGIEPVIIPSIYEYNSYVFCYEDRRLGDYDMNDVVIKGERLNETTVKWTLMATGAEDELYIKNIDGNKINDLKEVHEIFNKSKGIFINTEKDDHTPFIIDVVNVPKSYSFLDITTQPYIYNKTMNWDVKISRKGEDPHAIMIPYNFRWPLEQKCIKNAYLQFNSWGLGSIENNDWYKYPEEDKVY